MPRRSNMCSSLCRRMPGLGEAERAAIEKAVHRIISKLLHRQLETLKAKPKSGMLHGLLDAIRRLCHLADLCSVSLRWDLIDRSVLSCLTRGRPARSREHLAGRPRVKRSDLRDTTLEFVFRGHRYAVSGRTRRSFWPETVVSGSMHSQLCSLPMMYHRFRTIIRRTLPIRRRDLKKCSARYGVGIEVGLRCK